MTVTLEQQANQLILHLNSATEHVTKNEPNRTRKHISNFLLESRRFQRSSGGNWNWDRILLASTTKPDTALAIKALNIFLEKNGQHKRRNDLAKTLVEYFTNFDKPKEKNANSPREAGKVFRISKNTPSRKSSKALMADWVNIKAITAPVEQPVVGTPKPHHDHHQYHQNV